MNKPTYSIIIPTAFDFLEKHLRTCINSIIEYTNLDDDTVEIIVVSNGATDKTDSFIESLGHPFKLLTFPEALGYAKATNAGIRAATKEYIVFFNNDCKLLPQSKNQWLDYLVEPHLKENKIGVTGPLMLHHECDHPFVVFFCAMMKASLAKQLMLSEEFGAGYGEDVDINIRAANLGYKNCIVPYGGPHMTREPGKPWTGPFPLEHDGGATVNTVPGFDALVLKNIGILMEKHLPKKKKKVLAFIPTKNRYNSLASTLHSLAMQTVIPDALVIYDDGEHKDLRQDHTYQMIFKLLEYKKIQWKVLFGDGKGQHHGHQWANTQDYDFILRVDDDEILEPNVLEGLLKLMGDDVGAVAGSVFIPGDPRFGGSGKMTDIFHAANVQWGPDTGIHEVEHLYSTFLYRPRIVNYDTILSPAAHREETLFTNKLHKAGYRLIVDTSLKTYHYKQPTGGIRDKDNYQKFFFDNDDRIFLSYLEKEQGIKVISLNNGLGDHLVFLNLIPELQAKFKHLVMGVCYPEVFKDLENVTLLPVVVTDKLGEFNIYKWCIDHNWKKPLLEAYREMYNV